MYTCYRLFQTLLLTNFLIFLRKKKRKTDYIEGTIFIIRPVENFSYSPYASPSVEFTHQPLFLLINKLVLVQQIHLSGHISKANV